MLYCKTTENGIKMPEVSLLELHTISIIVITTHAKEIQESLANAEVNA